LQDRFQQEPDDENGEQGYDGFLDSRAIGRIAAGKVIDPLKHVVDDIHEVDILCASPLVTTAIEEVAQVVVDRNSGWMRPGRAGWVYRFPAGGSITPPTRRKPV
jgi:hypothetical protein